MLFNQEGQYEVKSLSKHDMIERIKEAAQNQTLRSYIGYPDVCKYVEKHSGVKIRINKKAVSYQEGDQILVLKKKYIEGRFFRLGENLQENDYEFMEVSFKAKQKQMA